VKPPRIVDEVADRRRPDAEAQRTGRRNITLMPETDRSPAFKPAKLVDRRRLLHDRLAKLRRAIRVMAGKSDGALSSAVSGSKPDEVAAARRELA